MNTFLVSLIVATLALSTFANVVPSVGEQNFFSDESPVPEAANAISTPNATDFDLSEAMGELMTAVHNMMPCGNLTYGIPPLAPYRSPLMKVNYTAGPLSLKGEIENLVVLGLNDYTIIQLSTNRTTNRTVSDMIHKDIQILGKFNLDVEADIAGFKQNQPLTGFVNIQLLNVRVTNAMVLGPNKSGGTQVSGMEYSLQIGDIIVNNLNTEWSVAVNSFVNRYIREFTLLFLQENREAFSKRYSELSTEMANEALKNIPFDSLAKSIELAITSFKAMSCYQ